MEKEIIAGLVARGFPQHVAAGMVANMLAESGLNAGVNEAVPVVPGSRGGYGLNQWTGPRRVQYEAFAKAMGKPVDDMATQLDFTAWEMQNTEKAAYDKLLGTTNAIDAARVYSDAYLRPGVSNMDRRIAEAARLSGADVRPQGAPGLGYGLGPATTSRPAGAPGLSFGLLPQEQKGALLAGLGQGLTDLAGSMPPPPEIAPRRAAGYTPQRRDPVAGYLDLIQSMRRG
jgi:hypothetical protein